MAIMENKPEKVYPGGVGPLAPDIIRICRESNGFVLELGVHTGEGSLSMIQDALAIHPRPLHISVDWEDVIRPEHRPVVNWWALVIGDTRSASTFQQAGLLAGTRCPGVIFIDTDHNYDQMKAELELWGILAGEDTVWLFHDTWMYGPRNDGMIKAIEEYMELYGWEYKDLRTDSHGLGIMRRVRR